jgi:hypothetical protein
MDNAKISVNGGPDGAGLPSIEQDTSVQTQMFAKVQEGINPIIGTMIRGLIVSAPGVPTHVLLNMIAWTTGNFLASALQADITTLIQMRKGFKDCFDDGIRKAKMVQPPMPPDMNVKG